MFHQSGCSTTATAFVVPSQASSFSLPKLTGSTGKTRLAADAASDVAALSREIPNSRALYQQQQLQAQLQQAQVADTGSPCRIKVIGVGGGGSNAVNRMITQDIVGV